MAPPKRSLPAPERHPEAEPYWAALQEGRLLVKRCPACGQAHHYPRPHCPHCGHRQTEWEATSGRGRIYSHTVVRGAPKPTAVAVVELDGGLRLTAAVVECDVLALRIDDELQLTTVPGEGGLRLPAFTTPAAERARAYAAQAQAAAAQLPADLAAALGSDAGIDTPSAPTLQQVAVVGAGSMGVGICAALLLAGLAVVLIDRSDAVLVTARQQLEGLLQAQVERGRLAADVARERLAGLLTDTRYEALAQADLVIEAVWEQMALKQQVFAEIDRHARPGAVLGSNTSTLDIDQIAAATTRPGAVVGLHFFSPAQVMPLLEVVRGPRTDAATLAAGLALGQRLGKTAVVVGVCDGFVGNRLMIARDREAQRLLLEGALPEQVDRVLTDFGLPMGTYALADMAGGIELAHRARSERGDPDPILARLVAAGRLGQKTGKGYYRYEPGKRRPLVDAEVTTLIEAASAERGITRRAIDDAEVHARLVLPMINEAAKLIEEGVVSRASDIDVVWLRGFGWPAWKGGPVYHADRLGLAQVAAGLRDLHARHGERFQPAALIERLAREGGCFLPGVA